MVSFGVRAFVVAWYHRGDLILQSSKVLSSCSGHSERKRSYCIPHPSLSYKIGVCHRCLKHCSTHSSLTGQILKGWIERRVQPGPTSLCQINLLCKRRISDWRVHKISSTPLSSCGYFSEMSINAIRPANLVTMASHRSLPEEKLMKRAQILVFWRFLEISQAVWWANCQPSTIKNFRNLKISAESYRNSPFDVHD